MINRYTKTVDLTSRGLRSEKEQEAQRQFPPPEPPLPPATKDTLPPASRTAFDASGWSSLMPVQASVIPYMLDGRNMIVQSRTGSGKTGAFLLPLFDSLNPALPHTQALTVTPTRELARQIHGEFERMNVNKALRSALVYGGVGYSAQNKALAGGAHLVIGTPGRLLDHLRRGTFTLENLTTLILDEADEMLSMGFLPAMQELRDYLPAARRSYMFSATMPPRVRALGRMFLHAASFLSLSEDRISVDTIQHRYYRTDQIPKERCLIRLLEVENPPSAIIFANTRYEVGFVAAVLSNYGLVAAALSGDFTQGKRERTMQRLRSGRLRILVATDVAARGIDVSELSHVIQYEVPNQKESYIHRTGRTARAGRAGTAITLATFEEESRLQAIARFYSLDIERRPLPTEKETTARMLARTTEVLEGILRGKSNLERERLQRFIPWVKALAAKEPELLAMLVDDVQHRRAHGAKTRRSGRRRRRPAGRRRR